MKIENKKDDWSKLSIGEFIEINSILQANVSDEIKLTEVLSVLTDVESSEIKKLPLFDFKSLVKTLDFLKEEMPTKDYKGEYKLNDTTYKLQADVTQLTTAQYIDFQNYIKPVDGEPIDQIKLISCFLVPLGHEYGDGYDIEKVFKDIESMNLIDANAVSFFLLRQSQVFTAIFLDYSTQTALKEAEIPKEKWEEIMKPLMEMEIL